MNFHVHVQGWNDLQCVMTCQLYHQDHRIVNSERFVNTTSPWYLHFNVRTKNVFVCFKNVQVQIKTNVIHKQFHDFYKSCLLPLIGKQGKTLISHYHKPIITYISHYHKTMKVPNSWSILEGFRDKFRKSHVRTRTLSGLKDKKTTKKDSIASTDSK